jgi:putative transposase
MPEYRRNRIPGGTYFFTVNLLDRHQTLLVDHIELLRASVRRARELMPFHIDAWVVLPDHMHALWTLPANDSDYSRRWQTIKMGFSKGLPSGEAKSLSRDIRGERGIWQRRYWEHTIRNDVDFSTHMNYIHFNPVKHGLVTHVAAWPYSSFHRAVSKGLYPPDWTIEDDGTADRGERPDGAMRSALHPT